MAAARTASSSSHCPDFQNTPVVHHVASRFGSAISPRKCCLPLRYYGRSIHLRVGSRSPCICSDRDRFHLVSDTCAICARCRVGKRGAVLPRTFPPRCRSLRIAPSSTAARVGARRTRSSWRRRWHRRRLRMRRRMRKDRNGRGCTRYRPPEGRQPAQKDAVPRRWGRSPSARARAGHGLGLGATLQAVLPRRQLPARRR